jgi:cbb3-type cytochrome oxidase maturation protein
VESLFILIPLAILIAFIIAALFFWAVKSGQFDDMKGPAHSILMDDDSPDLNLESDPAPDAQHPEEDKDGSV